MKFVLATVDFFFLILLGDPSRNCSDTYSGIICFFVEENAKIFSLET